MNKTTWESTVKPVVVLSVISLVVSLLLAVVNSMTAPVIAENERATTLAAYVDVMPSVSDASTLEEVSGYTTANVSGAVKAEDGSMAIKAGESGFDGGVLTVIMGFDAEGKVTGISIISHTETAGLGATAAANTDAGRAFRDQFIGMSGTVSVTKDGGEVDALTGATITSRAVCTGVSAALACAAALLLAAVLEANVSMKMR